MSKSIARYRRSAAHAGEQRFVVHRIG
jgi:hypothetical protein